MKLKSLHIVQRPQVCGAKNGCVFIHTSTKQVNGKFISTVIELSQDHAMSLAEEIQKHFDFLKTQPDGKPLVEVLT
jgi:hypothetical protein